MGRAPKHASHHLIHHPVVRVALVVALLEAFRQQQTTDEIPNSDVAASEL